MTNTTKILILILLDLAYANLKVIKKNKILLFKVNVPILLY